MFRVPARLPALACVGGLVLGLTACGQLDRGPQGLAQSGPWGTLFGMRQAAAPVAAEPVAPSPTLVNCPRVDVREGTEVLRTFDAGGQNDSSRLRWQAFISETARECRSRPTEAWYSVGISGRLVLGPSGVPGRYDVPLRVVFMRGQDQIVTSRLVRVPVTIAAGQTSAPFTQVVDEITIPREVSDPLANVSIVVGFDPTPERPQRPQRRRSGQG